MPKIKYISKPSYIRDSLAWCSPSIFPKILMTRPLFVILFIDLNHFFLSDYASEATTYASEATTHASEATTHASEATTHASKESGLPPPCCNLHKNTNYNQC